MRLVIKTSDRKQELSDFGWTLGQVPGSDGSPLKIADIAGVDLFVYDKADTSTVLYSVTLQPAQVFFDSLQLSPKWTEDTRGYNFAHYLAQQSVFPVNSTTVIERGGHTYRLEYRINTVNAGLVWLIRESTSSPVVSTGAASGGGGGGNADFSITLTPSSTTIFAGFQQDILVHITGLNGFLGTVSMTAASASGTIPGATLTWIPNPSIIANGDGTLRIAIDANAGVAGSYTINVTGSYNTLTHTVPLTLQVQQVGGGSQGWSTFTQNAQGQTDRTYYVSFSTGDDGNDGLAGTTGGGNGPKKTLAAGLALLRNGTGDWLLLNKGDTWAEKLGNWTKSGRSFAKDSSGNYTDIMRIGAYGTGARPKIATTQALGDMMFAGQGVPPSPNASFLAFTEIEFTVSDYNGSGLVHNQKGTTLINLNGGQVGFLMEGCWLHNAWQLMTIFPGGGQTTRGSNQIFRRNLFTEAYSRDCTNMGSTVQPSGAYIEGVDGLLFEENFWDNCGWIDGDDTTRVIDGSLGGNLYRHVIYVQNGVTGILWKGNIACRTDAVLCRGGGIIRDNLFLQLATGLVFGDGAFAAQNDPFGVSGIVRGNAWLGNSNLSEYNNGALPPQYSHTDWRGWAFGTSNTVSLDLSYNIIAHSNLTNSTVSPGGGFPFAWRMNFIDNSTNGNPQGLNNVTMDNNVVYKWPSFGGNSPGSLGFYSEGPVNNFIFSNNRFSLDNTDSSDGRHNHIVALRHTQIGAGGQFHSGGNVLFSAKPTNVWFSTGSYDNDGSGPPDIVEFDINQFKAAVAGLNGASSDTTTVAGTSATLNFPAPDTANMPGYMATIGGPNTLQDFINGCKTQSKDSYQDKWTAAAVLTYIRAGFGVVVPP